MKQAIKANKQKILIELTKISFVRKVTYLGLVVTGHTIHDQEVVGLNLITVSTMDIVG